MIRGVDKNGSYFIAWEQPGGFKRAWVQHRSGEKDWARTGRYVNVVRIDTLEGGPSGSACERALYPPHLWASNFPQF